VGFIGWREDLDMNDITIKYSCPTKLYDYISFGMPVVYIKNTALDKWNNIFGFGYGTKKYDSGTELAMIFNDIKTNPESYISQQRKCVSLYHTQLNYEYQSSLLIDYLKRL